MNLARRECAGYELLERLGPQFSFKGVKSFALGDQQNMMDNFVDIPSPQFDSNPELKVQVMRVLLTDGSWVDALRLYQKATGSHRAEAEAVIMPLDEQVRSYKATVPIRPSGNATYTLDDLSEINWWVLDHAYGAATRVPDAIRALTSDDASARDEALTYLFGSIAHQGSVYSATVVAVPFLVELVRDPSVPDRRGILHLLYSVTFWHYRQLFEEPHRTNLTSKPQLYERVYDAVCVGIPLFLDLLNDLINGLQLAALEVLSRFRGDSDRIVPHVRRLLNASIDRELSAMLVISLSYFQIDDPWAIALCDDLLLTEQMSELTFAAAVSRTRMCPHQPSLAAIRILAMVAVNRPRYVEIDSFIDQSDMVTYPTTLLEAVPAEAVAVAAPILGEGLTEHRDVEEDMERWYFNDLARTIVAVLFNNPNLPLKADPPLAALRRAALRAITRHERMTGDRDGFRTIVELLPTVFASGTLGAHTSAQQLTEEQQVILRLVLQSTEWTWDRSSEVIPMAQHLLTFFFAPEIWRAGLPAAQLTAAQRAILGVIAGSGEWKRDPGRFPGPSLGELLHSFALPDTPKRLRAYLQGSA